MNNKMNFPEEIKIFIRLINIYFDINYIDNIINLFQINGYYEQLFEQSFEKEYDVYEPAAAQAAAKYELKPCFKTDSDLSANFEQNKLRKTTLK